MPNTVSINGTTIITNVKSIRVAGGRIIVDGQDITPDVPNIVVSVQGDIDTVTTEHGDVVVEGSVGKIESKNGNIQCRDVQGDVTAKNGNISCGTIHGDATTKNGNIR